MTQLRPKMIRAMQLQNLSDNTQRGINALDYLNKNPNAMVVVLTGAGHAQKNAIPRQIRKRSEVAHAVILPEIKGVIDSKTVDQWDADYIMLDL